MRNILKRIKKQFSDFYYFRNGRFCTKNSYKIDKSVINDQKWPILFIPKDAQCSETYVKSIFQFFFRFTIFFFNLIAGPLNLSVLMLYIFNIRRDMTKVVEFAVYRDAIVITVILTLSYLSNYQEY